MFINLMPANLQLLIFNIYLKFQDSAICFKDSIDEEKITLQFSVF